MCNFQRSQNTQKLNLALDSSEKYAPSFAFSSKESVSGLRLHQSSISIQAICLPTIRQIFVEAYTGCILSSEHSWTIKSVLDRLPDVAASTIPWRVVLPVLRILQSRVVQRIPAENPKSTGHAHRQHPPMQQLSSNTAQMAPAYPWQTRWDKQHRTPYPQHPPSPECATPSRSPRCSPRPGNLVILGYAPSM